MVNNALVGGNPADILSAINPENVESVELKRASMCFMVLWRQWHTGHLHQGWLKIQKDRPTIPSIKVDGYSRGPSVQGTGLY